MHKILNYGNNNIGDEKMNKKVLIWSMIVVFAVIAGFITYKIVSKNTGKQELNENTKNMVEISSNYSNSSEDIDDLQVGIEVVGTEALNKMLEDFE